MALPSRTSEAPGPEDASTNETPLLSAGGRDFLSGKIDVDKYVDTARIAAAAHARQDFDNFLRERRHRWRSAVALGLSLATIAYAALGVVTLVSKKTSTTFSVVALVTSAFVALLALNYGLRRDGYHRRGQ